MRADASLTLGLARARPGGLFFTCEHASNRVPRPYRAAPSDRPLLRDHWGYDLGAAALTRALATAERAAAVLSTTSRLVLDPNRDPADPSLILAQTHDGPVSFNQSVSEAERAHRIARFHAPFHAAVNAAVRTTRPRWLISVHSFTSVWQGTPRTLEAGVLFDRYDSDALALVEALRAQGFRTEANEPYSGKAGLIYSAARHGADCNVPYLELEFRQDLLASPAAVAGVTARVHAALQAWGR